MAATSVGQIALDLVVNQNQFKKQMSGITSLAKKAGASLASAFAVKKIVEFGAQCIELGSDLQEVQNVVDVTFPKMKKQVDEFSHSAAASFGLSETMAKRFTGTFGSMAKAFGFGEQQAYEMASALTGLAGDVASFYNISQDEAYTKLKSVFSGETETLKDLGVVMTQSVLDAYALANGYGKTTSAMSEMEKVALRYAFVQEQLSAASGDFIRTSDGWANQVRVLKLQFDSLKASIGQGLINLLTPVLKVINAIIARLVVLANAFKSFTEMLMGKKSGAGSAASDLSKAAGAADTLAKSTAGVGTAAAGAAKQMRALMGFDAINKLSEESNSSDSGSGSGGSVNFGSLANDVESSSDDTTSGIKNKFDSLLEYLDKKFAPIFKKVWEDCCGTVKTAWDKWGDPILENIRQAMKKTGDVFRNIWNTVLKPVWDTFMQTVNKLWNEHLLPFVSNFLDFVGELVNGALEIYNGFIAPVVNWFVSVLGPVYAEHFSNMIRMAGDLLGSLIDASSGIVTALKGVIQFLVGVFTADWNRAWTGVKNIFRGVFNALVAIARSPINQIIGIINGMINGIVFGVNTVIRAVNSIRFDMPKWLGGGHVGFNLSTVSAPRIPYLAEGGYVRANTPRLAVIGDNKRYGEIVSPENKMQAMVDEAVARAGSGNSEVISLLKTLISLVEDGEDIVLIVDGQELARATQKGALKLKRRYTTADLVIT